MTWHRPPLLKNVGFLKGLVHTPRTPQERQADAQRASSSGGLQPRGTVPGSSATAMPPRSTPPRTTVAQATLNLNKPTPGLQALLDRANLAELRQTGQAIDLGSGGGRDTRALAAAGWHVHAIDTDPVAASALKEASARGAATVHVGTLDTAALPAAGSIDVANAQRVLPFLGAQLPATLDRLSEQLRPGGVLVASFFGPEHSWGVMPRVSTHDAATVRTLLESRGFDVTHLDDTRQANQRAAERTDVPMWHEIRVQAQRRAPAEEPSAPPA